MDIFGAGIEVPINLRVNCSACTPYTVTLGNAEQYSADVGGPILWLGGTWAIAGQALGQVGT